MKASVILAVAMAAIPGVAAVAQTPSPAAAPPAPAIEPTQLLPGQVVTSGPIVGLPVYDPNGVLVGPVEAVVVDTKTSTVAAVLIGVRGFLGYRYQTVGVLPGDLVQKGGAMSLSQTKRELQLEASYNATYLPRHY
jgi:sporulation protein YlmC with PRC-barrel domain